MLEFTLPVPRSDETGLPPLQRIDAVGLLTGSRRPIVDSDRDVGRMCAVE